MKECTFCKIMYPATYFYAGNLKCKACYQAIRVIRHPEDFSTKRVEASREYLYTARSDYKLLLGLEVPYIFRCSDAELLQMGEAAAREKILSYYLGQKHTKDIKDINDRLFDLFN